MSGRKTIEACAAACIATGCIAAAHFLGVALCPVKRFFGVPCPTCGSTRAFLALARGSVAEAFEIQPFVVAASFLAVPALVASFVSAEAKGFVLRICANRIVWIAAAVLAAANWAYVILRGN